MRNFIVSIIFVGLFLLLGLSVVSCIKETFPTDQPAPTTNQSVPSQEVTPDQSGDEVLTDDDCGGVDEYGRPRKNRPHHRRHLFPRLHRNR